MTGFLVFRHLKKLLGCSTGTGFASSASVFLSQYHSINIPSHLSFVYQWRYYEHRWLQRRVPFLNKILFEWKLKFRNCIPNVRLESCPEPMNSVHIFTAV
jgi:hypothetical protein